MIERTDLLALMVVTDATLVGARDLISVVRRALQGGAPAIQLRAKTESARETMELAVRLREETRSRGALLIINDRVDIALASDADGAHLGEDDLPLQAARRIVPAGFILGASIDAVAKVEHAERDGADYLGVGPVYPTSTKADAGEAIGVPGLSEIAAAARVPVLGIGGIRRDNCVEVIHAGASGIAVVGAVMAAPDPENATRELLTRMSGSPPRR